MNVVWRSDDSDTELWLNGVNMGWVDDELFVNCMWMAYREHPDDDPRQHLIDAQYPEDHQFDSIDEAKAALLESAVVAYIGGFRGR